MTCLITNVPVIDKDLRCAKYPTKSAGKKLNRKSSRKNMNTRMHMRRFYNKLVFFTSDKRYHKGFLNNISLSDAFIETQDNFSYGQVLKIFIPGRKFVKGAVIHGEVARLTQKGIGLKFRKNKQDKIVHYV
jgi:hypothetical protein